MALIQGVARMCNAVWRKGGGKGGTIDTVYPCSTRPSIEQETIQREKEASKNGFVKVHVMGKGAREDAE